MKISMLRSIAAILMGYAGGIAGTHFGLFLWPNAVFVALGLWLVIIGILFYKEVLKDT